MAATPPRPWKDLPDDILGLIVRGLPRRVDRGRLTLVCHAWHDGIRRLQNQLVLRRSGSAPLPPPLRALPWLLLPATFPDGSALAACVLGGFPVHHYVAITPPGARWFGSQDGGWIFIDTGDREPPASSNAALNVRTGDVHHFPGSLASWVQEKGHGVFFHAAALSSSPEDENYVGAAILTCWRKPAPPGAEAGLLRSHRCVAFWGKDWTRARDYSFPEGDDILYHQGSQSFLFVTESEDIRVCKTILLGQGHLMTEWAVRRFRPGGRGYEQIVQARYLVEADGNVLMVVRFKPRKEPQFRLFLATERQKADGDTEFPVAKYPWAWKEIRPLQGRMLFLQRGCSRSYSTDQYPGFEDGLYFLDDGDLYNEEIILGLMRQYSCTDNGKWSSEGGIHRCFPLARPSDYSPPCWLLP